MEYKGFYLDIVCAEEQFPEEIYLHRSGKGRGSNNPPQNHHDHIEDKPKRIEHHENLGGLRIPRACGSHSCKREADHRNGCKERAANVTESPRKASVLLQHHRGEAM